MGPSRLLDVTPTMARRTEQPLRGRRPDPSSGVSERLEPGGRDGWPAVGSLPPSSSGITRAAAEILHLQRFAGNAAVLRSIGQGGGRREPVVQRCGSVPPDQCPCHDGDEASTEAGGPTAQRDSADGSSSVAAPEPPATSGAAGNLSASDADRARTLAEVKPLVDDAVASLGPAASTVIPVPVASEPVAQALQRDAPTAVQRDGGGAAAYHPEGGVVASIQLCYDLMNGDISLTGWLWAGAGYKTPFGWYGGYTFVEGTWNIMNVGGIVTPGVCETPGEHGAVSGSIGGGVAPFPVMITPGERARFAKGGLEIGVLFTLHRADRSADLEMIGLLDVKKYLGPFGAVAAAAEAAAQRIAAGLGERVECGAGFDLSLSAHLCKAADPAAGILGYTASSLKLCGGGFVGCNINLSRSRAALPGGGH